MPMVAQIAPDLIFFPGWREPPVYQPRCIRCGGRVWWDALDRRYRNADGVNRIHRCWEREP